MQQPDLLLVGSSSKGAASVCDGASGMLLRTLKDCKPVGGQHGLCGHSELVLSAERGRAFVHAWGGSKEQPAYRMQVPEKLGCVACTADGAHLAAGGASGKLYLWQLASGRLLLAWDAHFKACTAVAACAHDGLLVTAGADAIVLVWSFASLLQAAEERRTPPPPLRTWTEHALPVRALAIGECGQHSLIASASDDHTLRVWRIAAAVTASVAAVELLRRHRRRRPPSPLGALRRRSGRRDVARAAARAARRRAAGGGPGAAAVAAAARHAGEVAAVVASADGLRVFSCAGAGGVWMWSAAPLVLLSRLHPTLSCDALAFLLPAPATAFAGRARMDAKAPLLPLKKFAEPAADDGPLATERAMGCVPVVLRAVGGHGGGVASAVVALDPECAELPLLAGSDALGAVGGGAPLLPPAIAAEVAAAADGGASGGGGGGSAAQLRAQVAQWEKINTELFALAAGAALAET